MCPGFWAESVSGCVVWFAITEEKRGAAYEEDSCGEEDGDASYVDGDIGWVTVVCTILLF